MASTIARLCPTVAEKLQVRRKYKTNQDGKTVWWWFLIRGDEQVLVELEGKWDSIALQRTWKLEDCYKYNILEQQPASSVVSAQENSNHATSIAVTPITEPDVPAHENNHPLATITSISSTPSPSVHQQ